MIAPCPASGTPISVKTLALAGPGVDHTLQLFVHEQCGKLLLLIWSASVIWDGADSCPTQTLIQLLGVISRFGVQ